MSLIGLALLVSTPTSAQQTRPESFVTPAKVQHQQITGVAVGSVFLSPVEQDYSFCKLLVTGLDSPPGSDPANDDAGYRLVDIGSTWTGWQWWTSALNVSPAAIDRQFDVTWVNNAADAAARARLGCTSQPSALRERAWKTPVETLPIIRSELPLLPGQLPLTETTKGEFRESAWWNEGRIVKAVEVKPSSGDRYVFCRFVVDEETRSPNDEPHDQSGKAGYRLVSAHSTRLSWQAWVEGSGHLWGGDNWLTVTFTVTWIRADALNAHRYAERCLGGLPETQTPYTWVDVPPSYVPIEHPAQKYTVLLRRQCAERDTGIVRGSADLEFTSPVSCSAARDQLERVNATTDICRDGRSGNPLRRVSGPPDWRWTSSCPTAGR